MNRKALVGILIAVPVVIIGGILFFLGQNSLLPGQPQPTRIGANVTPFAGTSGSAPTTGAGSATGTTTSAATSPPPAATPAATPAAGSAVATRPAGSAVSATTAPSGSSVAGGTVGTVPAGANAFVIVADKSQAKATVNEKLARLPSNSDAVLTTNAIRGQIVLGADGKPTTASSFEVDLRTLKSDSAMRDNDIKKDPLEVEKFPVATYAVTGVDGWSGPLKDGQKASFKLVGNLTIHGTTKPITFETTATMQGTTLTGTASTKFTFNDFGLKKPDRGFVVSADEIKLEMEISAQSGAPAAAVAPTTAAAGAPSATSAPATTAGGASTYAIVADKSQAKTTVNEKLANLPTRSDAVHTTNAMRGQIVLGADGKPTSDSTIEVDLRTLKSDSSQRDNFIQRTTLQTAQFPTATFVVTGVEGWNGPLKDGQQATFKLVGNLTIHGVTKPATFDTTATMQGSALTGTAVTQIKFQDFGMENPNIANIVSTDNTIKLEMTISAQKG